MSDVGKTRAPDEVQREWAELATAHFGNETARDAFLAVAHTALFAASVSFVGELARSGEARLIWLLLIGWAASVVGLCALTGSYFAAARAIRARQDKIHDSRAPGPGVVVVLNAFALWTFPIALISIFLFAARNVIS